MSIDRSKPITRISMVPGDYGHKVLNRLGGAGPHIRVTLNGKSVENSCLTADSKAGYVDILPDFFRKKFTCDFYRLHGKVEITVVEALPK